MKEARKITLDAFMKETREGENIQGPYELPEGWKWVKLKDMAEIIMGQSPPSTTYNRNGVGLPFYQGKADFGEKYPVPRIWCSEPTKIAEANDVLISVRAPVGPVNLCREKSCIGRGLAAIRTKNYLNNFFLFYYLRSIENKWVGKGSTFEAIKKKDLENLLIPLPPLEEQERIVSRLNELVNRAEEAKRLRRQAREEAEKIMQAALNKVFSRAEEEGWEWVKLENCCEINPSSNEIRHLSDDTKVTFVPMTAVSEVTGRIEKPEVRLLGEVRKGYTYFREGDVLFAKITPCMENGKSAIARNLINNIGFGSTEFHVLRPLKGKVISEWIYYYVRQKSFREEAARNMTGSVGQQRVPVQFMKIVKIPLPSIDEQRKLAAYLNKMVEEIEILKMIQQKTEEELEKLVPAILDKAFRGGL